MKSQFFATLIMLSLAVQVYAQDTNCGAAPCEESLCGSPGVLLCSDWNDLDRDGWAVSPGGQVGIEPGVGMNGTPGWHMMILEGGHDAKFFDKPLDKSIVGYGPLHGRLYVKFSPGYIFKQPCGLNKIFYLMSRQQSPTLFRIMLGVCQASRMGGSYASQPDTVGVFGFDYTGHFPAGGAVPNQSGDNPILIQSDRWYCVEIMAHWVSPTENTVKVWVDGTLQMTRVNYDDGVWTPVHKFDYVMDSSYIGGSTDVCSAAQDQSIYKDNHVVATHYIGPIGGVAPPPPPPPDTLPPAAPTNLQVVGE